MEIHILSNIVTLVALIVLFLLYALEFIFKFVIKSRFSLLVCIMIANVLLIVLSLICQTPIEEIILVLMISAVLSLLLGRKREG